MANNMRNENVHISKSSSEYRQTMDKIKSEMDKLSTQFSYNNDKTSHIGSVMSTAASQENLSNQIDKQRRKKERLAKEIEEMEEKINARRAEIEGATGVKRVNEAVAKKIKSFEHNLENTLQKYNEAYAANKKIRDEIDTLRRERNIYENISRKLEEELNQKKKLMEEIVARGQAAHKKREEVIEEMNALRKQGDSEQAEFEATWRKLGKMIDKDKQMKDFVVAKNFNFEEGSNVNEQNLENQLKRRVSKSNWGIAKDQISINIARDKERVHKQTIEKIQEETGISDIDEIIKTYIETEKHNYSLQNYVDELNGEIESLDEQIGNVQKEIDQFTGQNYFTDSQRVKVIKELEGKIKQTEEKTKEYEDEYENTMKVINALKIGVMNIFNRLGCTVGSNKELEGGITESNLLHYLAAIETRTNDILQMFTACQQAPGVDSSQMFQQRNMQNPANATQPEKVHIDAPDIDEYVSDDSETMPFTTDEMNQKVAQTKGKPRENKDMRTSKRKK